MGEDDDKHISPSNTQDSQGRPLLGPARSAKKTTCLGKTAKNIARVTRIGTTTTNLIRPTLHLRATSGPAFVEQDAPLRAATNFHTVVIPFGQRRTHPSAWIPRRTTRPLRAVDMGLRRRGSTAVGARDMVVIPRAMLADTWGVRDITGTRWFLINTLRTHLPPYRVAAAQATLPSPGGLTTT